MAAGGLDGNSQTIAGNDAACSFADLPDAVLVRILASLPSLQERQQAALVCKRMAVAACTPELLRHVTADITSLSAMRSFSAWLLRYRQHVRQLEVLMGGVQRPEGDAGAAATAAAAVATCLAAAGTAGGLERLTVRGWFYDTEWLAAMGPLQQLQLSYNPGEHAKVAPAISLLTALRSLDLCGGSVSLHAAARLPPSITRLRLCNWRPQNMPHQVAQLPRLERLTLCFCGDSPDSLAPLSRVAGSLTRLHLVQCHVPGTLAALTRLRHLSAGGYCGPDASVVIGDALHHMTQLTCLVLRCAGVHPPAALTGLASLQRCYVHGYDGPGAGGEEAPQLPAGPWLASLRWLGADIDLLASSVAVLQQATALEFVEACEHDAGEAHSRQQLSWRSGAAAALFDWLAEHPPLRRVSIEPQDTSASMHGPRSSVFDSYRFAALLARLARRRPRLQLRCSDLQADFSEPLVHQVSGDSD